MDNSDSIFLFELFVEELTSFIKARNFNIKAKFGDVFAIKLKDPNELIAAALQPRRLGKRGKRKFKVRNGKLEPTNASLPSGQTIMIASDIDSLVLNMMKYPIELSIFSKDDPFTLGLAEIPWNEQYLNFLKNLKPDDDRVVVVRETHRVFDEYTSKCVALLKLKIQINQIRTTINIQPTVTPPKHVTKDKPKQNPGDTLGNIPEDVTVETGTIKTTIYSGGKRKVKGHKKRSKKVKSEANSQSSVEPVEMKEHLDIAKSQKVESKVDSSLSEVKNQIYDDELRCLFKLKNFNDSSEETNKTKERVRSSIVSLVRSQSDLVINKQPPSKKHWSSTSLEIKQQLDTLNYIFGITDGPFGNKVYCVNYFTVENGTPPKTPTRSPPKSPRALSPTASVRTKGSGLVECEKKDTVKYSFKICDSTCKMLEGKENKCFENVATLNLPQEAEHLIDVIKCARTVTCDFKKQLEPTGPREPATLVDMTHANTAICTECQEQMEMKTTMKVGQDPCFCTCECTFGFVKKTTYCQICGGYERAGDEIKAIKGVEPFPCPIYHKLAEVGMKKGLGKTADGSELKRSRGTGSDRKSFESEKDSKKGKKKKKRDDRFKFNYGYKGIPPQIGHSQCALPCTGDMNPVPKRMGWLWTADNIPGLKVRPNWRPGAANKHVVRMLKMAKYPEQVKARRKKDTGKKKRPLKRPLLIVQKSDGEYTVTMETMRQFNKPRAPNQYPYEDKPVVTYTIGRTDEENRERRKRKERAQRRLEREQRAFIQSAFTDMCKEICQKTYEQALGLLPFAEDPPCLCYPLEPDPTKVDLSHSCSCTESTRSSESATDDDEWIVEFTPPNAYFNPAFKGKKIIKTDRETQHSYLDYRVKLLDRFGNPVPRFFIGPDGKQECSDLGGFWDANHKWLEINVDGYIAPDGRWAPNYFFGPNDEHVDGEAGKFQLQDGTWLVVGVDGYVDAQNKWRSYGKRKDSSRASKVPRTPKAQAQKNKECDQGGPSEGAFSCFGVTSPRTLSQMGIVGHGHDRRLLLSTLERMMKQGEDVKIPQTPMIPKVPRKKGKKANNEAAMFMDRNKCRHPVPSTKGIMSVDAHGRKTYFTRGDYMNPRPKERLIALHEKGISVSSFHVPCHESFIDNEAARRHQYEHILQHNARVMKGEMDAPVMKGHKAFKPL